jgi:DNA-directed RNA polymerase beta subunit
MEPDHVFDKAIYADGGGGRVVDIRVHHDNQASNSPTPVGMDAQAERYDRARRQFYSDIVYEWKRLERERKESLRLTPEFHRLVVEALSVVSETKERIYKLYRKAPLDDWRIEFTIEYDITPTIGFKLTDTHGGKGVICNVVPADHMPVDVDGNRADIVMDPNSTVSRMNLGRKYELYINAHSRDVAKQIRAWFGIAENDRHALNRVQEVESVNKPLFEQAWRYLMGYYEIVTPVMHSWFEGGAYLKTRAEHLAEVIRRGIFLHLPTNNPRESSDIVRMLEASYPSTYGPVTYVGNSGRRVTTKVPVRIGSVYIILLEKIADDWTAISSGKTQHYGVLSQVTNADKYALPYRAQSIRAWGEAEKRLLAAYVGPRTAAEIMDRNNNPETHKQILNAILEAAEPTDIYNTVDRTAIPFGGSRPLQLVKHILACAGVQFIYRPYAPDWKQFGTHQREAIPRVPEEIV